MVSTPRPNGYCLSYTPFPVRKNGPVTPQNHKQESHSGCWGSRADRPWPSCRGETKAVLRQVWPEAAIG
jgi:hypothetical protein